MGCLPVGTIAILRGRDGTQGAKGLPRATSCSQDLKDKDACTQMGLWGLRISKHAASDSTSTAIEFPTYTDMEWFCNG